MSHIQHSVDIKFYKVYFNTDDELLYTSEFGNKNISNCKMIVVHSERINPTIRYSTFCHIFKQWGFLEEFSTNPH